MSSAAKIRENDAKIAKIREQIAANGVERVLLEEQFNKLEKEKDELNVESQYLQALNGYLRMRDAPPLEEYSVEAFRSAISEELAVIQVEKKKAFEEAFEKAVHEALQDCSPLSYE
jgi:hypothetical protein